MAAPQPPALRLPFQAALRDGPIAAILLLLEDEAVAEETVEDGVVVVEDALHCLKDKSFSPALPLPPQRPPEDDPPAGRRPNDVEDEAA